MERAPLYLGGAGHGGFQNEILSFRIRFWIFRRDYFGNEIDFPEEDDPIYRMTVRVYSRAKLGIVFTFQAKDEALEYQEVDDCRPWEFWELNHRLQKECMRALMKLLFYKWAAPHVKVIQWLLENNYEAKDVFNKNMVLLYELTVERHVWLDNNPEIRDLMFRILDLEFSPEKPRKKPYEKSAKDWKDWLVCFRNRFDYTLPKLPPRVEVFLHAMRVDRAIEFFEDKIEDLIIEVSGPLAKKRLADEEDYRVRRGLLLFHFYCMLSHQPRDNPDANIDSRVAEQASFLQTLPPWLIAELESIYSLLETIICHHFRICCVARTSLPLHPNRSSRPSTPRIEYLMSQGLIKLRKVLEKTEYGHGNLMKDVPFVDDDQNDFFSTAMKKCWKWQKLNDGSRMPIYPRTMPRDQEHINFDKEPEKYWIDRKSQGTLKEKNADKFVILPLETVHELVVLDHDNVRGLVFWDAQRVWDFHRYHESLPVGPNPKIFDRKHFPSTTCMAALVEDFKEFTLKTRSRLRDY